MQLIAVALKALAGGTLVVAFSALSDLLKTKSLCGSFRRGAAPG